MGIYETLSQVPVDKFYDLGFQRPVLTKILWVFFLLLLYIANNHLANRLVYNLNKTKIEVEELRVEYTTIKHNYMFKSKQSEVAKSMEPYQVTESTTPPRRLMLVDEK